MLKITTLDRVKESDMDFELIVLESHMEIVKNYFNTSNNKYIKKHFLVV